MQKAASARSDSDLSPAAFKYIAKATFLSKYDNFVDRDLKENKTTGVAEVGRESRDDQLEQTGSDGRTLNGIKRRTWDEHGDLWELTYVNASK